MYFKVSITTAQEDSPQMVVFSESELHGMNIDGIVSGTTGSLLYVMVFVNERVYRPYVKKPVQASIEKVVHKEEDRDRHQHCLEREITFVKSPNDVRFVETIP